MGIEATERGSFSGSVHRRTVGGSIIIIVSEAAPCFCLMISIGLLGVHKSAVISWSVILKGLISVRINRPNIFSISDLDIWLWVIIFSPDSRASTMEGRSRFWWLGSRWVGIIRDGGRLEIFKIFAEKDMSFSWRLWFYGVESMGTSNAIFSATALRIFSWLFGRSEDVWIESKIIWYSSSELLRWVCLILGAGSLGCWDSNFEGRFSQSFIISGISHWSK